jgi:hypothetical protein
MKKDRAVKLAQEAEALDSVTSTEVAPVEVNNIQTEVLNTPLSTEEQSLLKQHEATIKKGLQTFHDVGMAFAEIRDRGLYREHGTFDEYCETVWKVSRSKAYRYMAAAKCVKHLECRQLATDEPLAIPSTESQARKISKASLKQQEEISRNVAQKTSHPTAKDFDDEFNEVCGEEKPRIRSYDIKAEMVEEKPAKPAIHHMPEVPMSQIAERIKKIYNIYTNSSKKQEGLNLFGELERWVSAWVDWETKKEVA